MSTRGLEHSKRAEDMKEVRVGILGTGGIAAEHIKSLLKMPGVKIVALADKFVGKAQAINAKDLGGAATCYSDWSAMLAGTSIDALHVCLPPGAHDGEVEAAAAKGIHLFLEKPIALDIRRAESMAAAIHKSGVKCQIGHHMRHLGPSLKLKAAIEDGSAGKPLLMQAHWLSHALHRGWWCDPAMGGGQLVEQAIHIYDWARYFLGDADIVTGFAGKLGHARFPEYCVDDNSVSSIRFRSGAMASLTASNSADPWYGVLGASVVCEKLFVHFKTPEEATFLYHEGMVLEEAWQPGVERKCLEVRHLTGGRDEINRNYIAAIRGEEPMRSSIKDGVEGLRLVLGVYQSSAQNGAPQKL